jgi:hypothetical protein
MTRLVRALTGVAFLLGQAGGILAQDTAQATSDTPALLIELNVVAPQEGACRLIFLAENSLGADLSSLVMEAVVFDREGAVTLLTLFDFRELPDARPRVRQFDLADTDCTSLGRVLLNDVHACVGEGITAAACKAGLRWSSRTEVEVLG